MEKQQLQSNLPLPSLVVSASMTTQALGGLIGLEKEQKMVLGTITSRFLSKKVLL